MQRVKSISVDKVWSFPGTSYSREYCHVVRFKLEFEERHLNCAEYAKVAAAWAPVVVNLRSVVLELKHVPSLPLWFHS